MTFFLVYQRKSGDSGWDCVGAEAEAVLVFKVNRGNRAEYDIHVVVKLHLFISVCFH